MFRISVIELLLILALCACGHTQAAKYIDPFLGTEGGGNVFPGPSLPFGMTKPGPDVGPNTGNAGWLAEGDINGFSQTHVSGTGGGAKYGNILVQPTVGELRSTDFGSPREGETASVGFYQVNLTRYATRVEITTARRVALYRFTYPKSANANILFDAGNCLSSGARQHEDQHLTASSVKIVSPREVSGSTTVTGGWNQQTRPYTVYFYAITDTPATRSGTWRDSALSPELEQSNSAGKTGAWLQFSTKQGQQVRLKVGISFISVDQARLNATREISGFDFEKTRTAAESAWNAALSTIEVQGVTPEAKQLFYTSLYHTMLMPVDRTGENPLWQSTEPYFDDFYAIWDTFRTSAPLLTLIAPKSQASSVRALIDIYRHDGYLPDARSGNFNGRTQGGSNAEFFLTDAYLKKLPEIDWNAAYAAELKDAEVAPENQFKEGRGGLEDYKSLGYVTIEGVDRPGSKQMEYAADDFEIALLAKALGKTFDYEKYLTRSRNWEKLWDSDFEDGGFRGFIRPRHQDGSWKQDFTVMQHCTWGGDTFYEGNSWTYSTFVPQDVAALIRKAGGNELFVKRLDAFFDVPGRYDVGNEPGFLAPYLYVWAGRHDKTAERVREIIARNYHTGRKGLPGNDDSGAMGSWYAFGVIGIFPNAGQDVYLIGSPSIPETTFHLINGKSFTVEARNVSAENKYVVAAEWNGKPYDKAWFRHENLM
ncbi:MAG: GH92 family glycosyl hydrolase, partial [Acidobacteria bacterium]|nr:GH92 family glycosyl hydrolase [Acidobacteriota bacterium]